MISLWPKQSTPASKQQASSQGVGVPLLSFEVDRRALRGEGWKEMVRIDLVFDNLPDREKPRLERFFCHDNIARVGDVMEKIHELYQGRGWFPAAARAEHSTLTCRNGFNIDFNLPVASLEQQCDGQPQMLAVRWLVASSDPEANPLRTAPKPFSPKGHECCSCGLAKPRSQFGRNQLRKSRPRCRDCCSDTTAAAPGIKRDQVGGEYARRGTRYLSGQEAYHLGKPLPVRMERQGMANMLEKASYGDGDFISLARQFEMYDVVDDVDLILRYDPQGAVERDRDVADIKRRLGEALHKVRKELDAESCWREPGWRFERPR